MITTENRAKESIASGIAELIKKTILFGYDPIRF
jgi:hypothetical protein